MEGQMEMAMPEPNESSIRARVEELFELILAQEALESNFFSIFPTLPEVFENVKRFVQEREHAEKAGESMLCAQVEQGEIFPIYVKGFVNRYLNRGGSATLKQADDIDNRLWLVALNNVAELIKKMGLNPVLVSPNGATDHIKRALHAYLMKNAIAMRRKKIDSPLNFDIPVDRIPPNHFRYRVHTDTSGLSVLHCPMYFGDPKVFGGMLSTPVDGFIAPGTYLFWTDKDEDALISPPQNAKQLEILTEDEAHLRA